MSYNLSRIKISETADQEPVPLQIHLLAKSFQELKAVQSVSFDVQPGEVVALLGPNGAGKSTTVGMIYGFIKPDSGTVLVDGIDIFADGRRARTLLGVVTQDDLPDEDFTVEENLRHFAPFYGLGRDAAESRVSELLSRFALTEHRKKYPEQLSGGLRRRLVLARALLGNPRYLCLDEPTTGLDPDARQLFWGQIKELKDRGCGVLLTTHYMEEAERLSDRVILLQEGKILETGTPQELIERVVGREVIEVTGLEGSPPAGLWTQPYGGGLLVGGPGVEELFHQLADSHLGSLTKRRANLEDVFIRISGARLQ